MDKITIDEKEYIYEDMTAEQKAHVNHITDIEKKIQMAEFNLEQMQFSKNAFIESLKKLL